MWFQKLLNIISSTFNGNIDRKLRVLARTNSKRFYVENVRSFFRLNTRVAKLLCEMAVKDGFFQKRIGLECPNDGRIIMSYPANEPIPGEDIKCDVCETQGAETFVFDKQECPQIEFYQLSETTNVK